MSVETNNLRSTKAILDAVVAALQGLKLAVNGQNAFARVDIFDLTDWAAAVRRLVFNDNRAALVIYGGDNFERTMGTSILTVDRTTRLDVLLTDRVLGDDVKAMTGDGVRPGTFGLLDQVLPALTGQILEAEEGMENSVYLVPTGVERVFVTDDDKKDWPGRSVLLVSFEASAPWLQVGVGGQSNY